MLLDFYFDALADIPLSMKARLSLHFVLQLGDCLNFTSMPWEITALIVL